MAQVNHKIRMRNYREAHLDSKKWDKMKADIAAGKRVGGIVPILNPMTSVYAYALNAYKAAGNEMPNGDDGKPMANLPAATVTSIRNGLMDDVGLLYAQTSIVKIDGKELSGDSWMAEKIKASKNKLHFRDFAAQLEALAKADKAAVVHRGVRWELDNSLVKYSSGKKGKQKKSILKTIDEI